MGGAVGLTLAVDWSGDVRAEAAPHPKLWVATAVDGELRTLAPSSRHGAVAEVLAAAERHGDGFLAALDLSFGYPAWFGRSLGCATGPELWARAADLDPTRPPFYGGAGSRAPAPERRYRATELRLRERGLRCGSTFQVTGPGSVGTGTLRGLPHLAALAAAGLRVWPFDDRPGPRVVEAYPRMFTGPVVKSRPEERARAWAELQVAAPAPLRELALAGEDAFDAALTAVALSTAVPPPSVPLPPEAALEGWVIGA